MYCCASVRMADCTYTGIVEILCCVTFISYINHMYFFIHFIKIYPDLLVVTNYINTTTKHGEKKQQQKIISATVIIFSDYLQDFK